MDRLSPSNVRLVSHVKELASPATLVTIPLLVALETRGTLITAEASEVLRLPETILPTTKSPGIYFWAASMVPDSILYAM